MRKPVLIILGLYVTQIILAVWGTNIFQKEANPFALLTVSALFALYCFQYLKDSPQIIQAKSRSINIPWIHAFLGMLGLFTAYEELRKIWAKYPNPENISDVIPQLKTQCDRFFTGEFPYQPVKLPHHEPYPVYMPMHWLPIQISRITGIDTRWSAVILLMIAVGIAGLWLSTTHANAAWKKTLPAMLLFALPVWAFVLWGPIDIAVSLEGIVAAWYLILAVGLATRSHVLIFIGLTGGFMSRYTFLFWAISFAVLLWFYAPRKYSYWIWGGVFLSIMILFVIPFWMKDPTIVSKILQYYTGAEENTWLRPDEYSFRDGLSLNIHLRKWLPGTPEENRPYAHLPQILVQLLLTGFGIYFYKKRWSTQIDMYTYSLILLPLMLFAFYIFSPMLFRYYMLMPLMVSAILCWKVIALDKNS